MIAPDLFSWTPPQILGPRDGTTFEPKRDTARLNAQARRVYNAMSSGEWLSLYDIRRLICVNTGFKDPEASISARIRDLRKEKFGGFTVERRYIRKGLWEYRLK